MLLALGFREEEGGCLVLPVNADLHTVEARRLELQMALELNQKRVHKLEQDIASHGAHPQAPRGKASAGVAHGKTAPVVRVSSAAPAQPPSR